MVECQSLPGFSVHRVVCAAALRQLFSGSAATISNIDLMEFGWSQQLWHGVGLQLEKRWTRSGNTFDQCLITDWVVCPGIAGADRQPVDAAKLDRLFVRRADHHHG